MLTHEPLGTGAGQVVLMLGVVFWMYGGYVWLTNAVTVDRAARRVLLLGWYHCHVGLLLGVVALAAGIKQALGHPADPLEDTAAIELAGGAALFLVSDVLFRTRLRLGSSGVRLLAAVVALAAIPVGTQVAAAAELALLVAVFAVAFAVEAAPSRVDAARA